MDKLELKRNRYIVFILGALAGIVIFGIIYGFACVNPTDDSFIINGYIEKDVAQHYAGWMLFRNSEWEFPLGIGKNIAYPYGSAVSYTDSIPLFAIFFRIFSGILPDTFQYFGLFVLVCFALQGAFGGLIGYHFKNDVMSSLFVSVIFILSPVMMERAFRHCALTAHFLILAALYYYFENRNADGIKAYIPFIVINAVSITIHPYFMPFTFGIMFAFCLERFFAKKEMVRAAATLAGSIALTLFVGYVIGAFSVGGSMSAYGYGIFSANLNSFINPQSNGISDWSKFIGLRPFYISYQVEGFNYLGFGIILFIPVSAVCFALKYRKDIFKAVCGFIKNYYGLIFSAAALFIFAVGPTVSWGGAKLFTIPWPDSLVNGIFGIFRANGRFVWIIDYLIVIFIVYELLTFAKERVQIGVIGLILIIAVQSVDLSGVIATKQAYFKGGSGDMQGQIKTSVLENPVWESLADKCDICYAIDHSYPNIGIDFATVFGKAGKAVNTQFEARQNAEKYARMKEDVTERLGDGRLSDGEVIVTDSIKQETADAITENGYKLYWCDNSYIICGDIFTESEILEFAAYGGFKICEAQAEVINQNI